MATTPQNQTAPSGSTSTRDGYTPDRSSPFTHHTVDTTGRLSTRSGPTAIVETVESVEKPWGHEEIFAVLEGSYVGKVLHIRAGAALSLQKHFKKDETLSVHTGQITVEYGPDPAHLQTVILEPGERILIRSHVLHRITAVTASQVLEASTAWPGWRSDIVRVEDGYGRQGTSTP